MPYLNKKNCTVDQSINQSINIIWMYFDLPCTCDTARIASGIVSEMRECRPVPIFFASITFQWILFQLVKFPFRSSAIFIGEY